MKSSTINTVASFGTMQSAGQRKRSGYTGSAATLSRELLPHGKLIESIRPSPTVESRKARQRRLVKHGPVYRILRGLQKNMSFPLNTLKQALKILIGKMHWAPKDEKAWIDDTAKLLKKNCRAIAQALVKNPDNKWVAQIMVPDRARIDCALSSARASCEAEAAEPARGQEALAMDPNLADDGAEEDESEHEEEGERDAAGVPTPALDGESFPDRQPDESLDDDDENAELAYEMNDPADQEAPAQEAATKNYLFGFCAENNACWRAEMKASKAQPREYTKDLVEPDGVVDPEEEPMIARWPDGVMQHISALTVSMHRAGRPARKRRAKKAPELMQTQDGRSISLVSKKDRNPLYAMLVNGTHVCQIRQDHCTTPEDSRKIMVQVAELLAKGEVQETQDDLYNARDSLLLKAGFDPPPVGGKRRKAAPKAAPMQKKRPAASDQAAAVSNFVEASGASSAEVAMPASPSQCANAAVPTTVATAAFGQLPEDLSMFF